jgi:Zn finger protein HypA/HybF involved in hydrogenase expression
MAKKAKKGKLFSSIVSAFSKKASSKPRKKKPVKKATIKKKVKKPVKRKAVIKKKPVKKIKRKVISKKKPVKKVSKKRVVTKRRVKKQIKKVVKKPKVKEDKFVVGFEEVVIKCPSCGRGFRIVKSSGFSTEGMLCQRCAAGGGMGLEEEGEL